MHVKWSILKKWQSIYSASADYLWSTCILFRCRSQMRFPSVHPRNYNMTQKHMTNNPLAKTWLACRARLRRHEQIYIWSNESLEESVTLTWKSGLVIMFSLEVSCSTMSLIWRPAHLSWGFEHGSMRCVSRAVKASSQEGMCLSKKCNLLNCKITCLSTA